MKIIVAGSRSINDYDFIKLYLNNFITNHNISNPEIVSGTANGPDKLGEQYAREHNLKLTRFPADWDRWGKSAGYKRNQQMADYAEALVAFWDGKSKGTKHMIDIATKQNLTVEINIFDIDN